MSATFTGVQMLVEGKRDKRFWEERSHPEKCRLVNCGGKETVLRSMARLDSTGEAGVVGIADSDLDEHFEECSPSPNILYTERHDLEALLLYSPAFERVIREWCAADSVSAFQERAGVTIREAVENRAIVFGKWRYVSRKAGYLIDFTRHPPARYLDSSWALNEDVLSQDMAGAAKTDVNTIIAEYRAVPTLPLWDVIHGHDAMAILRYGMSKVLNCPDRGDDNLFAALNMAFLWDYFESTTLFSKLETWQASSGLRCR